VCQHQGEDSILSSEISMAAGGGTVRKREQTADRNRTQAVLNVGTPASACQKTTTFAHGLAKLSPLSVPVPVAPPPWGLQQS
jgi:hypothetical protein